MSALSLSRELPGWLRCAVFAAKREIILTFKIESRALPRLARNATPGTRYSLRGAIASQIFCFSSSRVFATERNS